MHFSGNGIQKNTKIRALAKIDPQGPEMTPNLDQTKNLNPYLIIEVLTIRKICAENEVNRTI